jgi:hypothetical protein
MANTDSLVTVADFVLQRLEDHKLELGLLDVWRGDMQKLPRTPCATVESGPKRRALDGAPRRTLNGITVYVTIYVGRVQDVQVNARDADVLSEAVEALLHSDAALGVYPDQLAIHSLVTDLEPGYANKAGSLYRGARLTFEVTTKTQLPNNLGT